MARAPIFISRDIPGLGSVAPLAVNADASKVYIGRRWSKSRNRLNLLVLSLDRSGQVVGEPGAFPDSAVPLPFGGRSSVVLVHLHPGERKLYIGTSVDFPPLRPPWPAPNP